MPNPPQSSYSNLKKSVFPHPNGMPGFASHLARRTPAPPPFGPWSLHTLTATCAKAEYKPIQSEQSGPPSQRQRYLVRHALSADTSGRPRRPFPRLYATPCAPATPHCPNTATVRVRACMWRCVCAVRSGSTSSQFPRSVRCARRRESARALTMSLEVPLLRIVGAETLRFGAERGLRFICVR